ncbi:MAG: DUF896 domain-containing protein [Atopostipes suicloacalis]|nr:DUF896 domain-containing protein [Atopostipes suicloacalis]MDN6731009.1 DUF896 domain-containing protein [Atopostipes suicloacalis]
MSVKDLINRINQLASKSKKEELSEAEKKEQQELRQEYLTMIRGQVKNQLSTVKVVDEDGEDVTPSKLKDLKENIKKNNH